MNALDNHDEVAQLQAKVAMLTAALRKMDPECAKKVKSAAMLGVDCANAYTEIAEWSGLQGFSGSRSMVLNSPR